MTSPDPYDGRRPGMDPWAVVAAVIVALATLAAIVAFILALD